MLALTKHAWSQCEARGINPYRVKEVVNSKAQEIARFAKKTDRVLVVIEDLGYEVFLNDGSNGDQVVASVDPRDVHSSRPAITTVFVNRKAQGYSVHYTIIK